MNTAIQDDVSDQLLLEVLDDYVTKRSGGLMSRDEILATWNARIQNHPVFERLPGLLDSLDALHGFACLQQRRDNSTVPGSETIVPPSKEAVRQTLGDFTIIREVGRGGMGIVYEARQESLGRTVALKVLPTTMPVDARQISRFLIEVRAAGGLHHPNIVPVYWAGEIDGVHCYSMPLIDGVSLERVIFDDAAQSLSTEQIKQALGWITQAARALKHAHNFGVIHRDVKPSNLLLGQDGKVWVTDFGLARLCHTERLHIDDPLRDNEHRPPDPSSVTHCGEVVGTARYMSPEQADASCVVDHRSDVYSLGITLAEILTGQRYDLDLSIGLRRMNHQISRDLETVVMKAIAPDRDDRYQTADLFADDLDRVLQSRPVRARRPSFLDRTLKWTHRHQRFVTASTIGCVVALMISLSIAFIFAKQKSELSKALFRSNQNLRMADANLEYAEANFRETRRVLDHFGLMAAEQLQGVAGAEFIRDELVRDLLLYYERFVDQAKSNVHLQRELALTHLRAARVIEELGATQRALKTYRTAESLLQERSDNVATSYDLAVCRNNIATLLAEEGELEASEALYRQTRADIGSKDDARLLADDARLVLVQRRCEATLALC